MERIAVDTFEKAWRRRNIVLDTLVSATRRRISPHLQLVMRERGAVVCESGAALDYGYFPVGSVLSLLTVLESGTAVETASIGTEGAFGLSAVLASRVSFARCVVQLPGPLMRCPIDALRNEVDSEVVRHLCAVSSEGILMQVQQNIICNLRHGTKERLARWLLTLHDRAGGETLSYPQPLFAGILSETGQSVTLAAESMQVDELITYRRGAIQIVDRAGLEKASCQCYAILKKRYSP